MPVRSRYDRLSGTQGIRQGSRYSLSRMAVRRNINVGRTYQRSHLLRTEESGTLAYALGAGKAIISTPYWHAAELLDDGRGVLVPFEDPRAIAASAIELLDNDAERQAMRKRAYAYGRLMVWNRVAQSYMSSFMRAHAGKAQPVRVGYPVRAADMVASNQLANA